MKRLVYLLGIVVTVCILASCGNQQEAANKKEKIAGDDDFLSNV